MKRISELFITVCFLGFLAAVLFFTITREPATVSYFENRTLTAFPTYTPESVGDGSYTTQLEQYLDDHAALRETLLKVKVPVDLLLHRPVVNKIVLTEDRLLPYLPVGKEIVDSATVKRWSANMAENLKSIQEAAAEYGGYFCYVAVPCQYAYFEDDYPWYLYNRGDYSQEMVTGIGQALAERGVPFLDIRAEFDAMGHPDEYGSRVDNHYTMEGAFETYRLVMEKAAAESGFEFPILDRSDVTFQTLPNEYMGSRERKLLNLVTKEERLSILRPVEEVPFTRTDNGNPSPPEVYQLPASEDDLLTYNLYMGGDQPHTVIDTNRDELPSILIYGDSFTNAMECVAYLSFNEMHSLDLRYYKEKNIRDYIREIQPDIVVCIRDYEALPYLADNGGAD